MGPSDLMGPGERYVTGALGLRLRTNVVFRSQALMLLTALGDSSDAHVPLDDLESDLFDMDAVLALDAELDDPFGDDTDHRRQTTIGPAVQPRPPAITRFTYSARDPRLQALAAMGGVSGRRPSPREEIVAGIARVHAEIASPVSVVVAKPPAHGRRVQPAAVDRGWHPMSTCPTHSYVLIVSYGGGRQRILVAAHDVGRNRWIDCDRNVIPGVSPTHWSPIPPPPSLWP